MFMCVGGSVGVNGCVMSVCACVFVCVGVGMWLSGGGRVVCGYVCGCMGDMWVWVGG